MFKVLFFLHRRSDLSFGEFLRYSEATHIPLVARVPGLVRYVVNHTAAIPQGSGAPYDAVAELWFASVGDFEAAFTTPEGIAALQDQPNYLDMERTHMLFVNEKVVI